MPHIHDFGPHTPGAVDPGAPEVPGDPTRVAAERHGYSVLPGHLLAASTASVQDTRPRAARARGLMQTASDRATRTGNRVRSALPASVTRLGERLPRGLRRGVPWLAGAALLTTGFLGGAALGHDAHRDGHQVSHMMMMPGGDRDGH